MRLLDRYLIRELIFPLVCCLCGFLMFWIFSDLFTRIGEYQKNHLLSRDIAEYYLVSTPAFLGIVLPLGLLLALLYLLTNLSRHHEITAMRAAGISLWRVCLPFLLIGLGFSLALLASNELVVPDSIEMADRILNRRLNPATTASSKTEVRNLGFTNSRDNRTWQIGVYNTATGMMKNPQVVWQLSDGTSRWLTAARGVRINGVWTFYDAQIYREEPKAGELLKPIVQTNLLSLPEFSETPEQIKSEVRLSTSISLTGGRKADVPIVELLHYLHFHPRLTPSDHAWVFTRLHGRLAAPWTCLVVVLIAIPFGAASGRRNVCVGVASSLVLCFAYFVLQQLTLALGTGSYITPWLAAWLPNLFFGITGLWLTLKVR
jgi:lipopolysaccharide export system permease protein